MLKRTYFLIFGFREDWRLGECCSVVNPLKCGSIDQTNFILGCPTQCPRNFARVCGTDGQTYNNECLLQVAACNNPGRRIRVARKGSC